MKNMTVGMLMQMLANYPINKEVFLEYTHDSRDDVEWNCVPADCVGSGKYGRLVIGSLAMSNALYLKECLDKLHNENKVIDDNYGKQEYESSR